MHRGKRFLSLALMLALLLSLLSVTSLAEEDGNTAGKPFQITDSYVLNMNGFAYFSPFVPLMRYNGTDVKGYSILFGLKNTQTGAVMESAYCTDMPVDANYVDYQRLNLTDSTYAAAHADKLRAIVLGSYPYLSIEVLRTATGLETLSVCEAITGTQIAVWKAAHGDAVEIVDFLNTHNAGYNSTHSDPISKERSDYANGTDEHRAQVKSNIESLYYYLMQLPERSASGNTVSRASFISRSTPIVQDCGDGTYNITVTAGIQVSGGELTLTAYLANGAYYAQQSNITSGTYTLTIRNVPEEYVNQAVTLSLDGTQDAGADVFLLDAEGIRGASQSLIAPLSGTLPVHADIKCEPDRILKLNKTANGSALANISFEVYYVGALDDYLSGKLNIGTRPSSSDIAAYAKTENLVGTITTDGNGYGELNLGTDDGVYLVRELPNDLVTDSVAFFVSLPDYSRCDAQGNPAYTISASPKNTLRTEKVEIEKDVTSLDNEHDTFDIGETHSWIVQSSIPYGIGTAKEYTVSDILDRRLTLVGVDRVSLGQDHGTFGNSEDESYEIDEQETPLGAEELVLTENTDYQLHIGTTESGCHYFTLSLTAAGCRKIAEHTQKNDGYELRISYSAYINSSAQMGEPIPNQAHVRYTNHLDRTYSGQSDVPEVHTGGVQLLKTDSVSNVPLAGATFEIYRMAQQDELDDENIASITVGSTVYKMLPVSFYDQTSCTGEKVTVLTTDNTGAGYIYGLAYGQYYLVETRAPDGYHKLRQPVEFTVNAESHTQTNTIRIENTAGTELPETGGIGTWPFTVAGLLLICAAWMMLKLRRVV